MTTLARAQAIAGHVSSPGAGALAYGAVALVAGDLGALVALAVAAALVGLVARHRGRPARTGWARTGWRPSHVVELVLAAVVVRRDGVVRSVLGALLVVVAALAVLLLGLVVLLEAAYGLALLVGLATAVAVALLRPHQGPAVPDGRSGEDRSGW